MPSTSTSGPQCFIRTAWASSSRSGIWSSGSWSTSTSSSYDRPSPPSRTLVRARSRMSVTPARYPAAGRRVARGRLRGHDRSRCPAGLRRLPAMTLPLRCADLLAYDREHVWHPYTSMTDPAPTRLVTGADGVRLRLADGREVVDAMSSWWAAIHGYGHPALNAALREQVDEFAHVMFGGLTHEPAIRLAQRLVEVGARGPGARLPRRLRVGQRRGRAQDGAAVPTRRRPPRAAPDADGARRLPRRHVRLHERVRPGRRDALDVRRRASPAGLRRPAAGRRRRRRRLGRVVRDWPPSTPTSWPGSSSSRCCRAPAACTSTPPSACA